MIDRELLKDMGFVPGTGWDHEVWVYDGRFWVHYDGALSGMPGAEIYGTTADRRTFFAMFIARIVDDAVESATYNEEND